MVVASQKPWPTSLLPSLLVRGDCGTQLHHPTTQPPYPHNRFLSLSATWIYPIADDWRDHAGTARTSLCAFLLSWQHLPFAHGRGACVRGAPLQRSRLPNPTYFWSWLLITDGPSFPSYVQAIFADLISKNGLRERFGKIDSCGTANYHEGEEPDERYVPARYSHAHLAFLSFGLFADPLFRPTPRLAVRQQSAKRCAPDFPQFRPSMDSCSCLSVPLHFAQYGIPIDCLARGVRPQDFHTFDYILGME